MKYSLVQLSVLLGWALAAPQGHTIAIKKPPPSVLPPKVPTNIANNLTLPHPPIILPFPHKPFPGGPIRPLPIEEPTIPIETLSPEPFPPKAGIKERQFGVPLALKGLIGVSYLAGLETYVKTVCAMANGIEKTIIELNKLGTTKAAQPLIIQAIPGLTSQLGNLNITLGNLGSVTGTIGGLTNGATSSASLGINGSAGLLTLISTLLAAISRLLNSVTTSPTLNSVNGTTLQPVTGALGCLLGTVGNTVPLNTLTGALPA